MMRGYGVSPIVRLNIGGKKFCTTVDTLTLREPDSMLAVMFSGHHTVIGESEENGYIFIDRNGNRFPHILDWLRDGVVPSLTDSEYSELFREAEYFQLRGLMDEINAILNTRKEADEFSSELSRTDIIKCIQSKRVRFQDPSIFNFSFACLENAIFCHAILPCAKFRGVDAAGSIFENATLHGCDFTGAILRGALFAGANLQSSNLQDACLRDCSFCATDLRSADLQNADLTNANLKGANLERANLNGAMLAKANLRGANLQLARLPFSSLQEMDLEGVNLDGANLDGAIFLGGIR